VKEALENRLGLSFVVLSELTAGVNGPGVFHVRLIVDPETVAVAGEVATLIAFANAEAT
jgi:hypothetical protein